MNSHRDGHTMSRSSSARSNLSTSSTANNAGIGTNQNGRLPFFEKYQRVYGSSQIVKYPNAAQSAPLPKSSASSGGLISPVIADWHERDETCLHRKPKHTYQQQHRQQRQHYQAVHSRQPSIEMSESENSNTDSSNRSSDILGTLDTPETSPDFSTSPVFWRSDKTDEDQKFLQDVVEDATVIHVDFSDEMRGASFLQDDRQAEDDIIDSYPTPQQNFLGRFGALVVDDDVLTETVKEAVMLPNKEHRLVPPPETLAYYPLLQEPELFAHPSTRSISRGLPMSQSSPNGLARLAGDTPSGTDLSAANVLSSLSLNGRSRSRTGNGPFSLASTATKASTLAAGSPHNQEAGVKAQMQESQSGPSAGLGFNALDDLLKEMNRESLVGTASARASPLLLQKPESFSPSPSSSSNRPGEGHRTPSSLLSPSDASTNQVKYNACRNIFRSEKPADRDSPSLCSGCYTQLYLPKCKKCKLPIEGRALGSGDGKVKGKVNTIL